MDKITFCFVLSLFEAFDELKRKSSKIPDTDWSLEHGYRYQKPDIFPRRPSGSGENGGLKFDIWRSLSEIKKSNDFNKGFKLVVHLPCEIPNFSKKYYRLPLQKSVTLTISPYLIITETLNVHEIEKRQCLFDKESKLNLFKNYTISNCQVECLANYTRSNCSCIHYSMPRIGNDIICNSTQSRYCFEDARKSLVKENMAKSLETRNGYSDRGHVACGCLPPCTSLYYDGEVSYDDIRYFTRAEGSNR